MAKKILVPYDGSPPSAKAVRYATDMAREDGHSKGSKTTIIIILLHVVPEIPIPPMFGDGIRLSRAGEAEVTTTAYLKEVYQELKAAAKKKLENKKSEVMWDLKGSAHVPTVETRVAVGDPADKILEYAEDEKVDLIVIGNVSLKGIAKLKALGSVSRKVAERASCPVTIVR